MQGVRQEIADGLGPCIRAALKSYVEVGEMLRRHLGSSTILWGMLMVAAMLLVFVVWYHREGYKVQPGHQCCHPSMQQPPELASVRYAVLTTLSRDMFEDLVVM
jgi:hypothetical protein